MALRGPATRNARPPARQVMMLGGAPAWERSGSWCRPERRSGAVRGHRYPSSAAWRAWDQTFTARGMIRARKQGIVVPDRGKGLIFP